MLGTLLRTTPLYDALDVDARRAVLAAVFGRRRPTWHGASFRAARDALRARLPAVLACARSHPDGLEVTLPNGAVMHQSASCLTERCRYSGVGHNDLFLTHATDRSQPRFHDALRRYKYADGTLDETVEALAADDRLVDLHAAELTNTLQYWQKVAVAGHCTGRYKDVPGRLAALAARVAGLRPRTPPG